MNDGTGRATPGRRKRHYLKTLMMSTALSLGVLPVLLPTVQAQAQSAATHSFNIPSQPLSRALRALADQSGVQLAYKTAVASGATAPAVRGTMTTQQALSRLLSGSNLQYSFTNANTVTIVSAATTGGGAATVPGAIALDTINVQGQANAATTEGTNSYGSAAATIFGKDSTPIKETPQSISVVTHKRIEDQNLDTLDKAISNTTGMVVQQTDSDRPGYYSRGFPVSGIQIDGVPTSVSLTTSAQDLAMFDRVEVLRGPAGLLNGFGSPGGTINLVHKLPSSEFRVSNETSIGSYTNLRNQFDITGPLNDSKTLRGRVVGTLQSQDFIEDTANRKLGQLYGVLEGDLSENTTVRVGAYYQRQQARRSWQGVPAYSTGDGYKLVDAARSTFFGSPWNKNIYTQSGAFAELEHKFDNGWSTKASFNYLRYQSDIKTSTVNDYVNPTTMTSTIVSDKWRQDDQQYALDWYATGPVEAFGRTHKLTFGLNASHEDLGNWNYYGPSNDRFYSQTLNIFDLGSIPEPAFDGPVFGRHTLTNQFSAYGNARISLADPLTLVVGGRVLWWDSKVDYIANENPFGAKNTSDAINAKPIPYAGLVYDLNKTYSVYGSYASIFQPQTTRNAAGDLLKPIEGEQYEVGIKGSYLDDRLIATLALYQLTQKNRAMADPSDPTGSTYFAQGKARSQGIEAEISGRVTDRWNIFAGYTYTQTKNYDDSDTPGGVEFTSIAPKHLFRLWTTYNLPMDDDKWTIGGGIKASSQFYNESSGGRLVAGSYIIPSAFVSYKVNDHFTASLAVDNIFNKKYITSLGGTYNGFYGDPRTVTLKLKATW